MTVSRLHFLVEEPSMESFLKALLPKVLPAGVAFEIFPFQSKQDLLKALPSRLDAYSKWLPEDWRIVVVVDRDEDQCHQLKAKLEAIVGGASMRSKSVARKGNTWQVATRVAVEELEAWFFGEWVGVRGEYPKLPPTQPKKAGFRDPDAISGGTWEALERIMKRYGYFAGGLRKIELARSVGNRFDPLRCTSRSFQVFHEAIQDALSAT